MCPQHRFSLSRLRLRYLNWRTVEVVCCVVLLVALTAAPFKIFGRVFAKQPIMSHTTRWYPF
jgi:hypothetical protein